VHSFITQDFLHVWSRPLTLGFSSLLLAFSIAIALSRLRFGEIGYVLFDRNNADPMVRREIRATVCWFSDGHCHLQVGSGVTHGAAFSRGHGLMEPLGTSSYYSASVRNHSFLTFIMECFLFPYGRVGRGTGSDGVRVKWYTFRAVCFRRRSFRRGSWRAPLAAI
jgi:hypothetical protein